MKDRRAQGALEFLLTYGWAFLVILIMIGALAYFGVLSPDKLLPSRCTLASPLSCDSGFVRQTSADTDAAAYLRFANNYGNQVTVRLNRITSDIPNFPPLTPIALGAGAPAPNAGQFVACLDVDNNGACAGGTDLDIGFGTGQKITDGNMRSIVIHMDPVDTARMPVGNKVKLQLNMSLQPVDLPYLTTVTGELYQTVQ